MNAPRYLAGLHREECPDTFTAVRWNQDTLRVRWLQSLRPKEPEPSLEDRKTIRETQVVADIRAVMSDGRERTTSDIRTRLGDIHPNTIIAAMNRIGAHADWIAGPSGDNIRTWRLP